VAQLSDMPRKKIRTQSVLVAARTERKLSAGKKGQCPLFYDGSRTLERMTGHSARSSLMDAG
jgi:hypothetical protein